MLALLRPHLRVIGYGLLALCVGFVLWPHADDSGWDAYAHAIGAAHARQMAADAQALRQADSALSRQSATVTQTIVRYRAIRGIAGDTIRLTDTVWVKQVIAQSDSVVRACTELQSSCALYRTRAESVIADLHVENDALAAEVKALRPSRLGTAWARIRLPLAFVAGAYVGSRVVR